MALVFSKWRGFSFFAPGMWTSAMHCADVSDIDGPVWTVITWNLKSLYSCLPFLAHGRILHSTVITGSPLISPLCFIAQWAPSDLAAHSPSPPLWNAGRECPAPHRNTFPSFPVSWQPLHSPCPPDSGCSHLLYLSLPAFPLFFTLPSRSRAASCRVFWATCILISASSNLSLLWAFSSHVFLQTVSFLAPVPHTSSDSRESLLYWPVILGFPVLRSWDLQAMKIQNAKPNCFPTSD